MSKELDSVVTKFKKLNSHPTAQHTVGPTGDQAGKGGSGSKGVGFLNMASDNVKASGGTPAGKKGTGAENNFGQFQRMHDDFSGYNTKGK